MSQRPLPRSRRAKHQVRQRLFVRKIAGILADIVLGVRCVDGKRSKEISRRDEKGYPPDISKVEFLLKTGSGCPKTRNTRVTTPWQILGISFAIAPIGQLHQFPRLRPRPFQRKSKWLIGCSLSTYCLSPVIR